jgi:hypothetical protein
MILVILLEYFQGQGSGVGSWESFKLIGKVLVGLGALIRCLMILVSIMKADSSKNAGKGILEVIIVLAAAAIIYSLI